MKKTASQIAGEVLQKVADIVIKNKRTGEVKSRYRTVQTPEGFKLELITGDSSGEVPNSPRNTLSGEVPNSPHNALSGAGIGTLLGGVGGALIAPAFRSGRVGAGLSGAILGALAGGQIGRKVKSG